MNNIVIAKLAYGFKLLKFLSFSIFRFMFFLFFNMYKIFNQIVFSNSTLLLFSADYNLFDSAIYLEGGLKEATLMTPSSYFQDP